MIETLANPNSPMFINVKDIAEIFYALQKWPAGLPFPKDKLPMPAYLEHSVEAGIVFKLIYRCNVEIISFLDQRLIAVYYLSCKCLLGAPKERPLPAEVIQQLVTFLWYNLYSYFLSFNSFSIRILSLERSTSRNISTAWSLTAASSRPTRASLAAANGSPFGSSTKKVNILSFKILFFFFLLLVNTEALDANRGLLFPMSKNDFKSTFAVVTQGSAMVPYLIKIIENLSSFYKIKKKIVNLRFN